LRHSKRCRKNLDLAFTALLLSGCLAAQSQTVVPRAWNSQALSDWATPLAHDGLREGFFSEKEYYESPVDNYRTYPVYDPDREPPGYWESLKRKKPEPILDIDHIGPSFSWVAAGRILWEGLDVPALRLYDSESIALARSREYSRANRNRMVVRRDGTYAIYRWVITPKGIALGAPACSGCHTRELHDGTTLDGPGLTRRTTDSLLDRMYAQVNGLLYPGDTVQMALYRQFGVPWIRADIHEGLKTMSGDEIAALYAAQPAGAMDRVNGSPFYVTKVPDLIGIRDRKYIDHTATHKHRDAGDLMRYAALVECCDSMDYGNHHLLMATQRKMFFHWPDELLYALAQYVYSLQPPPNPNPKTGPAVRGEAVFLKAGCAGCHTPPLYTNNKLTLASGFKPAENHPLRADILNMSVGTDSNLALKTRKGTGFYKVPSLKGVWYRGLYGHDGAVSSLEDWFDPARLRDDYVPTGFKGYRLKTRAINGHEFGLQLSTDDKAALVAFLRTL
jgi:mono/diheme cytochrome c family protein